MDEDFSLCAAIPLALPVRTVVPSVYQRLRRKVCFPSRDRGMENTKERWHQVARRNRKLNEDREMERSGEGERSKIFWRLAMRGNEQRCT